MRRTKRKVNPCPVYPMPRKYPLPQPDHNRSYQRTGPEDRAHPKGPIGDSRADRTSAPSSVGLVGGLNKAVTMESVMRRVWRVFVNGLANGLFLICTTLRCRRRSSQQNEVNIYDTVPPTVKQPAPPSTAAAAFCFTRISRY